MAPSLGFIPNWCEWCLYGPVSSQALRKHLGLVHECDDDKKEHGAGCDDCKFAWYDQEYHKNQCPAPNGTLRAGWVWDKNFTPPRAVRDPRLPPPTVTPTVTSSMDEPPPSPNFFPNAPVTHDNSKWFSPGKGRLELSERQRTRYPDL